MPWNQLKHLMILEEMSPPFKPLIRYEESKPHIVIDITIDNNIIEEKIAFLEIC